MKIIPAPAPLRAAVHAVLVGQMASALLINRANLGSCDLCRAALLQQGFGENSVGLLLPRAISAATESLTEVRKMETGA